jgi:hypothetical protein
LPIDGCVPAASAHLFAAVALERGLDWTYGVAIDSKIKVGYSGMRTKMLPDFAELDEGAPRVYTLDAVAVTFPTLRSPETVRMRRSLILVTSIAISPLTISRRRCLPIIIRRSA